VHVRQRARMPWTAAAASSGLDAGRVRRLPRQPPRPPTRGTSIDGHAAPTAEYCRDGVRKHLPCQRTEQDNRHATEGCGTDARFQPTDLRELKGGMAEIEVVIADDDPELAPAGTNRPSESNTSTWASAIRTNRATLATTACSASRSSSSRVSSSASPTTRRSNAPPVRQISAVRDSTNSTKACDGSTAPCGRRSAPRWRSLTRIRMSGLRPRARRWRAMGTPWWRGIPGDRAGTPVCQRGHRARRNRETQNRSIGRAVVACGTDCGGITQQFAAALPVHQLETRAASDTIRNQGRVHIGRPMPTYPPAGGGRGITTVSEPMRDGPADEGNPRGKQQNRRGRAFHPCDLTAPPDRIDLSFAVWLARQLRRRRITQRELARQGGLDHSTISRILVGSRAPSWSTVQRIALVVGFPPSNVMLGRLGTGRRQQPASTRRRKDA
jgi:hypothetical protein